MISTKLALILMTAVGTRLPTVLCLLIICSAAVLYVYMYYQYLPYYSQYLNQLLVACSSVFAWASLCVTLAYLRGVPDVSAVIVLLLLLLRCPMGIIALVCCRTTWRR